MKPAPASPSSSISPALARRLFWRIVPLLFLIYVLNYIDRTNVGFAALQMNADLGFGPRVYGIGGAMFFFGYLLAEVPANLYVARVGARRALAQMMLAWGLAAGAMAFVAGETSFFAVRFLLGIAESGFAPAFVLYVSQWFPAATRGRAVGAISTATVLSFVVGGPLSGALLELPPWLGFAPWQWLFLLEALPTLLLALYILRNLSDGPRQADWLSADQRRELLEALAQEASLAGGHRVSGAWAALREWRLWIFFLVYLCNGLGFLAMALWLPQIIHRLQALRPFEVGLVSAVPFLLCGVAMIVGGWRSDRTGRHYRQVILAGLSGAAGFAASAVLSDRPVFAIVALTAGMVGLNTLIGPFWTLATAMLRGRAAAVGIAVISAGGTLGGFLGSLILGWLRERSGDFSSGLLAITGFLVLGALLTMVLAWHARRDARSAGEALTGWPQPADIGPAGEGP